MGSPIDLKNEEINVFDEMKSLYIVWDKEYDTSEFDKIKNLAHKLHMMLKNRGIEPRHSRHVLENRGLSPDDPEFYYHEHCIEDLIKFVGDQYANQPEDLTMDKKFRFEYFTDRWKHDDWFDVTRTQNGWKFKHLREYFLPIDGTDTTSFYEMFEQDSVSVPRNLHFKFYELWDLCIDEGYTQKHVQKKLDDIGTWISQSELYEPVMADISDHEKGVVTFLDILGWKGITDGLEDPLNKAKDLIKQSDFRSYVNRPTNNDTIRKLKHQMISISDTIILFTLCSPEDYYDMLLYHGKLSNYFITKSMKNKLLLRGATSCGEFSNFQNIFVGPAIDDAAKWYESCNWMGVILTPSASEILNEYPYHGDWLVYAAPYKTNFEQDKTYCLNWVMEKDISDEQFQSLFRLEENTPESISLKFKNTIKFYNENS
ncbi:MAG: hypothetical protein INQ03_09410 [Candidatus Heimdallarchaeota archaeon]|nr:hypothetical protein [Candidatus Heimdallarchaeota archaeon]